MKIVIETNLPTEALGNDELDDLLEIVSEQVSERYSYNTKYPIRTDYWWMIYIEK